MSLFVRIVFSIMLAAAAIYQIDLVVTGRCEHPRYGIAVHGALLVCDR